MLPVSDFTMSVETIYDHLREVGSSDQVPDCYIRRDLILMPKKHLLTRRAQSAASSIGAANVPEIPFIFLQLENIVTKDICTLVLHETSESGNEWRVTNVDDFASAELRSSDLPVIHTLLNGQNTFMPMLFPLGRRSDFESHFKLYTGLPRLAI